MVGYDETGSGEPLVLVHGSWDERAAWDPVMAPLAERFRVIAYDRRGHGGSQGSGTLDDDAADLAELIREAAGGRASVAANSLGGIVVLRLLLREPELVEAAALHEPPLFALLADDSQLQPALEESGRRIGAVLELIREGRTEEAARRFADDVALGPGAWEAMPQADREMMVRNAHTFVEENEEADALAIDLEALRGLDVPVLLSGGSESPPIFPPVLARLERALPRARRLTFEGAGHIPHLTHPDEYVAALVDFLAEPARA